MVAARKIDGDDRQIRSSWSPVGQKYDVRVVPRSA